MNDRKRKYLLFSSFFFISLMKTRSHFVVQACPSSSEWQNHYCRVTLQTIQVHRHTLERSRLFKPQQNSHARKHSSWNVEHAHPEMDTQPPTVYQSRRRCCFLHLAWCPCWCVSVWLTGDFLFLGTKDKEGQGKRQRCEEKQKEKEDTQRHLLRILSVRWKSPVFSRCRESHSYLLQLHREGSLCLVEVLVHVPFEAKILSHPCSQKSHIIINSLLLFHPDTWRRA